MVFPSHHLVRGFRTVWASSAAASTRRLEILGPLEMMKQAVGERIQYEAMMADTKEFGVGISGW